MEIQELPDIRLNIEDYYEYQDIELLDYVWEVANHFLPNIGGGLIDSQAPAIFCERYHQRNLTLEERYERHKAFYISNGSLEDYIAHYADDKPVDDSYKELYLNCRELQDTIQAFGLDVSKFWYMLLFVHDYIEDLSNNSPSTGKSTLDDINEFAKKLSNATCVSLKKGNRKIYTVEREETISIIQAAVQYYINSYNEIINSDTSREEKLEKLAKIGGSIVSDAKPIHFEEKSHLDISFKKLKFAEILLHFLKDRKATKPKNSIYNVSKDKLLFISRLIYVVGYDTERYYEEYDSDCNKNRMLSNLMRRYKNEKLPLLTGGHYTL